MIPSYEIRVKGHLDEAWAEWYEGLTITHQVGGDSLLIVPVADQAALHGILNRLRDLGVQLIAVNPVADPNEHDGKKASQG